MNDPSVPSVPADRGARSRRALLAPVAADPRLRFVRGDIRVAPDGEPVPLYGDDHHVRDCCTSTTTAAALILRRAAVRSA